METNKSNLTFSATMKRKKERKILVISENNKTAPFIAFSRTFFKLFVNPPPPQKKEKEKVLDNVLFGWRNGIIIMWLGGWAIAFLGKWMSFWIWDWVGWNIIFRLSKTLMYDKLYCPQKENGRQLVKWVIYERIFFHLTYLKAPNNKWKVERFIMLLFEAFYGLVIH